MFACLFIIWCTFYFILLKWHTEFGHLHRGDMLTSEQHRCSNEKNFSAEFKRESAQLVVDQNYTVADAAKAMDVGLSTMTRWVKCHVFGLHRSSYRYWKNSNAVASFC